MFRDSRQKQFDTGLSSSTSLPRLQIHSVLRGKRAVSKNRPTQFAKDQDVLPTMSAFSLKLEKAAHISEIALKLFSIAQDRGVVHVSVAIGSGNLQAASPQISIPSGRFLRQCVSQWGEKGSL